MNKKSFLFLSLFYGLFLVLAILFFFYDLEISKALVSSSNPIYIFFATIGEFPIYLGPILFGLVYGLTNKKKISQLISHFVGLIATYVCTTILSGRIFTYYLSSKMGLNQYILLAIASLLIYTLLYITFAKIRYENLYKIRDIALMALIVSIFSFLVVTGLKYIWSRPRYRVLSENYSEYTNFLTINGLGKGISDDYRSFPSGHTNAATSILIYALIPQRFTNKKWIKYLVSGVCFVYPFVVAFTRVGIGAHFASDVLFGFGISFSCLLITYIIFKKKGWLYDRGNKC